MNFRRIKFFLFPVYIDRGTHSLNEILLQTNMDFLKINKTGG